MTENKTASEQELIFAIKDLLKGSGHLNKLQAEVCHFSCHKFIFKQDSKARYFPCNHCTLKFANSKLRAKVTEALKVRQDCIKSGEKCTGPPPPTEEVLLINELVREYLEWNGYIYTVSVMTSEAGLPPEKRTRSDLCANVGVKDDDKSSALPLLANIVAAYTERIKRKISKSCKKDV